MKPSHKMERVFYCVEFLGATHYLRSIFWTGPFKLGNGEGASIAKETDMYTHRKIRVC